MGVRASTSLLLTSSWLECIICCCLVVVKVHAPYVVSTNTTERGRAYYYSGMIVPAPHLAFSDNLLMSVLGYHVKSWQQRKYRLPNFFAARSGARDVFCLRCLVGVGLFSLTGILSLLVLWLETDFS